MFRFSQLCMHLQLMANNPLLFLEQNSNLFIVDQMKLNHFVSILLKLLILIGVPIYVYRIIVQDSLKQTAHFKFIRLLIIDSHKYSLDF